VAKRLRPVEQADASAATRYIPSTSTARLLGLPVSWQPGTLHRVATPHPFQGHAASGAVALHWRAPINNLMASLAFEQCNGHPFK
jgi:hypothetical protein